MHAIESRPLAPVSRDHESSTLTPPCQTPSTWPCLSSCSEPLGPLAIKAYSTLRRWEITGAPGVQIVTIQSQHAYVAAWKPVLFPVQHLLQKLSSRLRLPQHVNQVRLTTSSGHHVHAYIQNVSYMYADQTCVIHVRGHAARRRRVRCAHAVCLGFADERGSGVLRSAGAVRPWSEERLTQSDPGHARPGSSAAPALQTGVC